MHRSRRTVLSALTGLLAVIVSGLVLAAPANAADGDVRINEFSSNSPDFVELVNTGSGTVDLAGWKLKDNSENNTYTFPAGSSLAAGEIKGLSGEGVDFAFGLGNGDQVRLLAADGTTVIDSATYAAHPAAGKSWGRCPDGTGPIVLTETATKGSANACGTPDTAVKVNEWSSNSPDFIELINTGGGPVDLSGWKLKDNSENNTFTFPAGSTIASGQILGIDGESAPGGFVFGLGNGDQVRLFADDGTTVIDTHTYAAHPAAGKSWGRCPNGTGAVVQTAEATKGTANLCPIPPGGENVKINEIESDPNDKVELVNTGETSVDLAGYVLKDNDDTHVFTIAAGTTLAAHAYLVIDTDPAFGLGKGDSVRLYTPGAARLLDSTTYPVDTHATNWGRCPDGSGDFGVVTPSLGSANSCGPVEPEVTDVVINEVESNGDQVADWVELKNRGNAPVNVSGWKILDADPGHAATPVVVPAGTTIPAGGYYAIYTEVAQSPGFGLGTGDSVTLFLADGTTQVDTTTWGAHPPTTWGRCPDGTGSFGDTTTPTRGLQNACSPVRINEIESAGGTPADWIELVNISASTVDASGLRLKDSDDAHSYTLPAGSSIPSKGYLVVDQADLGFELDDSDAVRLFGADGSTLIESYPWATPAAQSYGRCKDGVGTFADTKAPTKGAVNSCPGLETSPWPGAQTVTTADLAETFTADLSGLAFDPADPDVLWAAQNKLGTLFKLVRDANNKFVPAAGWPRNPKFADGNGAPDTEGITVGPDGFVYLTTERNNDASGVSRNTVLRFDPSTPAGATITPTTEWNLTPLLPAVGANLGLEGITFVPDSYLTANGFTDQSTGAAYAPSTYPGHGSGLYVVAYEANGMLYAFALDSDGTPHKVAEFTSGFPALADVDFDPELQRLRAVTDDTVDGKTSLLKVDGAGAFVVDAAFDRPVEMPNLNNEGLAVAPQTSCVAGKKEVLWSDDGDTGGFSLRRGSISCTVLTLTAPVPTITGTTTVGQTLTAVPGSWAPVPVALTYQWFAGANPISGATASTLVLGPEQAGVAITVAVTGTKAGYQTATTTSTPTAAVGKATLTATPVPTIGGTATVGSTLTATAGTWGPAPVALTYQWFAGSTAVAGATEATLVVPPSAAGSFLTVVVTGTKAGFTTVARTSAPTDPVAKGTLAAVVPTVTGTAALGQTLTADAGAWGPAPVGLDYQWFSDGVLIAGATGSSLVLGTDLVGTRIIVSVTGTKAGYDAASRFSIPTAEVAAGDLDATPTPTITGTAKVGVPLTVVPGTWGPAPVALSYQWFVNGVPAGNGAGSTFTPNGAHAGKTITVEVTGTKAGHTTVVKESVGKVVAKGTLTTTRPITGGTFKVGRTITAARGTWGPLPVTFQYRWRVDGVLVNGATGNTLKLTAAMKGKRVQVTVTGSKLGYTSVALASLPSLKVTG